MRILFGFTGGRGHFEPLVPLARAAERAGHEVLFASTPSQLPVVEALGLPARAIGEPGGGSARDRALRPLDLRREEHEFRNLFAGGGARFRAPLVADLCREWRPDVVVAEETDFGSLIAAERLELPYASVVVLAAGTFVRPDLVAETLDEVRRGEGLPPDPELAALSRYLVLAPVPPSFRDPEAPVPATLHSIRPAVLDATVEAPAWLERLPEPRVYFTLGTIFNLESGDLFERVLAGLGEVEASVVATTGAGREPSELPAIPGNVRVERVLDQSAVLGRFDAVVSHGGSGTVIGALAHGLPQVVLPLGADQEPNARRCAELGVGRVVDAEGATSDLIRDEVSAVLDEPAYRTAARRIQREVESLPSSDHAVALLERLAAEGRPLPSAESDPATRAP